MSSLISLCRLGRHLTHSVWFSQSSSSDTHVRPIPLLSINQTHMLPGTKIEPGSPSREARVPNTALAGQQTMMRKVA